jgi:hypothetical protein
MKVLTDSCLEAQYTAARLLYTVMIHIESGILTSSFGISYPQPWDEERRGLLQILRELCGEESHKFPSKQMGSSYTGQAELKLTGISYWKIHSLRVVKSRTVTVSFIMLKPLVSIHGYSRVDSQVWVTSIA